MTVMISTCRQILRNVQELDDGAWLYLPKSRDWSLDSEAAVLESEEVSPDEEDDPDAGVPQLARDRSLMQVLPISVVQDVVINARTQRPNATEEMLFDALLYYFRHDAFLDFG